MRDLIINGVPLRDPLKMWSIDYTRSSLFSQISRRFTSEDSIGYHGVDASGPSFFSSAQDSLVLNLQAADKDSWTSAYRALQALFMQPSLSLVSAPQRTALVAGSGRINRTFNASPDDIQVASARMLGTMAIERINERAARLTILLERPNSFWMSEELIESTTTTLAGTTTGIEIPSMADSTGPITDGLIRVQGPITAGVKVTVRDRNRPENAVSITPTQTVTNTQYILIDLRSLLAKRLTTNVWDISQGVDARGIVSISSDGGFNFTPEFPGSGFPDIPNRYFMTVVRDGTDAAMVIQTRLRRSYLS